ncbi:hypothetical protein B0H63DRAFT_393386 [Podospora didyma]|uniref:Uncharacterized protein n=1 Tax=Podospora didyma TaxID=330526 RepID=A0AAE0U0G9_9PEZI|nr:hypothetical protein B0H63DRAFT_393386 [Podospora didyma]
MSKLSQTFPPAPSFTERNLPDQTGRVFIITGAASGVGLELSKMLFGANATIYLAARSSSKINEAVQTIRQTVPSSTGRLEALVLDLSDLRTIKPAVELFLSKESRLDVLVHNAGVMNPPLGSTGAQGHELQMATHSLGPFLLTSLLSERLVATAAPGRAPFRAGAVRVVWVTSMISLGAPKGGVVWDQAANAPTVGKTAMENYMQSKVGSVFLAHEYARRVGRQSVVSVSVHPGLMKTDLQRHMPAAMGLAMNLLFKGPKFGAYSELFAAVSPEVTLDKNGGFIIPWGRFGPVPCDIASGMKTEHDGGTGLSERFWAWCEQETAKFR